MDSIKIYNERKLEKNKFGKGTGTFKITIVEKGRYVRNIGALRILPWNITKRVSLCGIESLETDTMAPHIKIAQIRVSGWPLPKQGNGLWEFMESPKRETLEMLKEDFNRKRFD